jgi:glycerophosphoryl diester phosphodiesterase
MPANSLSAIVAAADAGYGIEIDIQVTRDGVPFIIHENNTMADSGIDLFIPTATAEEVGALSFLQNGEKLCTLDDVFREVGPDVPLLLDVKQTKEVRHTVRSVAARASTREAATAIQSFQPTAVWYAKKLLPHILVGQLGEESNYTMGPIQTFQTDTLITNFVTRPDFIGMYLPMLRRRITSYWRERLQCPFVGWTVVDDEDIELCRELGVSMVFEKVRP